MDRYAIALGKTFRHEFIPGSLISRGPELSEDDIVEAMESYIVDKRILRFLQEHPVKDIKKYLGARTIRRAAKLK